MRRSFILVLFFTLAAPSFCPAQIDTLQMEKEEVMYQLKIYKDVTEYLDEMFRQFSAGHILPHEGLRKTNLLKHEYNKLVRPVPEKAQKLNDLVNQLLSRVENYFIYYERFFRESPEINLKIARSKFELAREADRLMMMYV
ncbi:MAG: hypothetical protein GF408_04625 [Candidatus Omnitrophica bacterium]|nr:hypothetical protein [Candidatus Omnitrophota bacterium]